MVASSSVQFRGHPNGGLSIWREPDEEDRYILAVDTAGGGANGDPSVGLVLSARDAGLCAIWKDRDMPSSWGRKMALLGWYYREALLAVEVYPATSGLAACHEAMRVGYSNVYLRRQTDTITRDIGTRLGWRTDVVTKPGMIADIAEALATGISLPSEELVQELGAQRFDAAKKMYAKGNDDLVTTLGIALAVRRDAMYRQLLAPPDRRPRTDSERVWASILPPPKAQARRMVN